ncbi:MAG: toll/interleukin-1 receptor domain-containing protein [Anaerolineales bacterium]|nr:MAG: toll/interleukin-1 receptor domain-containing protein [Anaerolineales bacterium]
MEGNIMTKPTIFISYSREDEKWKDCLHPHLKLLEKAHHVTIWDDSKIDTGDKWFNEIETAISEAAVAVCLISADYLASDFCIKEEIPTLLERREKTGMVIIPVMLRPCFYKAFPWLKETQMLPGKGKCVSLDFKNNWEVVFTEVAESIFNIIHNPEYKPPEPTPLWSPPEKIDIHRMPITGAELFGRQNELELLDNAWESDKTNVVSLVAWGGVGKSTLVNKWLEQLAADNYRGARRVFAWSFFSQGTNESVTSADLFIAEALDWFGDPDPKAGSPWDKGQRLADLIHKKKTLLLLDGLEPLQSSYEYERGKVKDPALATLLSELARQNPGLCVITTRETVADLAPFMETSCQKDLMKISDEAGRALLRVSGVQGTDAELEAATSALGNHALAISLLGVYIHGIPDHRISYASEIPVLDIPEKEGRHPRRMIAAFEQRYGKGPEMEVLRMLGLFNRPVDAGEIYALKAAPVIPDLTEHIHEMPEADWLRLLKKLRHDKLIASESRYQPELLDAHPIVREHFGQQLRETYPETWREGNNRLYEHLKQITKEYPDTVEEMMPLYAAVAHGCQAGRYHEALNEVYSPRILRGNEYFSTRKLGAFGASLAAMSGFFDQPWSRPAAELTEADKGFILNQAGFYLRGLGRLAEATQPMQASLEAYIAQENWINAAKVAGNLSELSLTMGDLAQALEYAEQSVDLADRSSDAFEQMSDRTTLADALHQAGRLPEAEAAFQEAEEMQKERQPEYPLLYSVQGFQYCDLLLGQGKYQEVLNRVGQTLEWAQTVKSSLLTIALDHLSLEKAHLLQARQERTGKFTLAAEHLNQAVDGLRQAGTQHHNPRSLLARTELSRVQGAFKKAQRDLDEAMTIAKRGEMRLHQADCQLEYARLYLAMVENEKAQEHLATAKEMIGRMGYHRRDGEVEELESMLG